jgi:hypothetical protein
MNRFRLGSGVIACASVLLLPSTSAVAGVDSPRFVIISGASASGSFGSARNSADSVQYMGCTVASDASGVSGAVCFARDSASVTRSCTTSVPEQMAIIRSLGSDSYLAFFWNSAGQCTSVSVYDGSNMQPK